MVLEPRPPPPPPPDHYVLRPAGPHRPPYPLFAHDDRSERDGGNGERVDIIIEEGSVSSRGRGGNGRGRRVVGLRMQQERWERISRRGSDVEGEGGEERGDDDGVIYMRRSRGRNRGMETRRGDRGDILRVRKENVRDRRQREEMRSGGEGERRGNGNRGRGHGIHIQRPRARGRFEMRGALQDER